MKKVKKVKIIILIKVIKLVKIIPYIKVPKNRIINLRKKKKYRGKLKNLKKDCKKNLKN